jgi:hypothetical protein
MIEAWDDKDHWPDEISQQHPNVKWRQVICQKGAVRISDPLTPHGSTGPATKVRRTILPWLVLVRNGVMENPKMGTYEEICEAHRNLTSMRRTPSGHPNKYGGINWAFPADVHLDYQSWIQKALVGQVNWDNRLVQKEIEYLMSTDQNGVHKFINKHRNLIVAQIKDLWKLQQTLERQAFAADSSTGAPCRSYFDTNGVPPPRTGEWWKWDSDFTQGDALTHLEDEISLEPDEQYYYRKRQNPTIASPTNTAPTLRSRSNTIVATDVAVPPTPTPAQRRSKRVANQGQTKK